VRVRRFKDTGRVRLAILGDSAHAFVYAGGATVRWRRRDGQWRHVTVKAEGQRFAAPSRGRVNFRVETWRTEGGTTERVKYSKRYVLVKILV
jgi:hypothetical protein